MRGLFLATIIVATASNAVAGDFDWSRPFVGGAIGSQLYDQVPVHIATEAFVGFDAFVADNVIVGLEGSVGYMNNGKDDYGQALVSGRVGVLASSDLLLYGTAGVGTQWYWPDAELWNDGLYTVGGGAELAATESLTVRGQALAVGNFDDDETFNGARTTIGLAFRY